MILAEQELARCPSRQAAYNRLQVRLMRRWMAQGHTTDEWVARMAIVYARRYRWVLCPHPDLPRHG